MEIKSYGWETDICRTVSISRWLIPEALTDPLDGVDHAIDQTKEKLSENEAVKNIRTEIHMPLDEYRYMIKEALLNGQYDAWDLARRIVTGGEGTYNLEDMRKLFGSCRPSDIFNLPPDEAIAKDKKHQEEQEKGALHVGDEVEFTAPGPHKFIKVYKGYVIRFDGESPRWVSILAKDGMYYRSPLMCTKTGKHNPDIEKVMASFEKGENND